MNNQIKTNSDDVSSVAKLDAQPASYEIRTCHNYWCNYSTNQPLPRCPKCNRALLTAHTFRRLGLALIFIGGILAATGALLLIFAAPKLLGGMGVKLFVWSIFALLLAIGLTIMAAGSWQALFGRRNQSLITFMLVLLITILLVAAIGRNLL
jgi:hypothetical protein